MSDSLKRKLIGRIVSNKMQKTVTVLIERKVQHSLYGKYIAQSKKYHAHNESFQIKMGDLVEIVEGRPISKTKSWSVSRIVEAARSE